MRTATIRASHTGRCPRYIIHHIEDRPMEPTPRYLQKIFDAGNRQEDETVEHMLQQGHEITDRQREVATVLEWPEYGIGLQIIGHIDGILNGNRLLEIKAMSSERFQNVVADGELERTIRMQLMAYAHSLRDDIDGITLVCKQWGEENWCNRKMVQARVGVDILRAQLSPVIVYLRTGAMPVKDPAAQYECETCKARFNCYPEWIEEEATQ